MRGLARFGWLNSIESLHPALVVVAGTPAHPAVAAPTDLGTRPQTRVPTRATHSQSHALNHHSPCSKYRLPVIVSAQITSLPWPVAAELAGLLKRGGKRVVVMVGAGISVRGRSSQPGARAEREPLKGGEILSKL